MQFTSRCINYPFPANAGHIGLLWFAATFPQLVHRVLNKLPETHQEKTSGIEQLVWGMAVWASGCVYPVWPLFDFEDYTSWITWVTLHERNSQVLKPDSIMKEIIYTVQTHAFDQQSRVTSAIVKHTPDPAKRHNTVPSAERSQWRATTVPLNYDSVKIKLCPMHMKYPKQLPK